MRRNYGQSSALNAGLKACLGEVIITMDGDGQNDPNDIPLLLKKIEVGYDAVCGWRRNRRDPFSKKFLSRGAAVLRRFLVDDGIHDAGCTLRAYNKECFEDLDLYAEFHRMIPALLKWRGFNITEIEVNHRPRILGKTKYDWRRVMHGFLDMVHIWFWRKYSTRPLHLFGSTGVIMVGLGGFGVVFMAVARLFFGYPLSNRIWPLVAFFFILIGFQFLMAGLISADLVEHSKSRKYYIKDVATL